MRIGNGDGTGISLGRSPFFVLSCVGKIVFFSGSIVLYFIGNIVMMTMNNILRILRIDNSGRTGNTLYKLMIINLILLATSHVM